MHLYWTRNQIPELRDRTVEECHRIWRSAFPKLWQHWEIWLHLAAYVILVMLLTQLGMALGYKWIGMGVGILVGNWLFEQAVIYVTRRYHSDLFMS
jgi:hypothetical protein